MPVKLAVALPASIDYTDKMSPVGNQFSEGTCVGFACVDGLREYQEEEEWKRYIDLSVRYVYANAKKIDDWPNEEGTSIRYAMKILSDKGVCPEDCWRYIPNVSGNPCDKADELAVPYQIDGYWRIDAEDMVQAMKEALVANGPFTASFVVFDGINHPNNGVVPMPGENENYIGGHALCIVGYDDTKKLFKFKNSWGRLWGESGYGYFHYDYIEDYMMDAWSAKDKLGGTPPPKPWWWPIYNIFARLFGWPLKE